MKKVLIIEDDLNLAHSIIDCLGTQLYQIFHESEGTKASIKAQNGNFDIILLDINLPVKSGYVIARELRSQKIETPIIAITGRSDLNSRLTCWQMGIDKILLKPFSFDELQAIVKQTCNRPPKTFSYITDYKELTFDPLTRSIRRDGQLICLRKKEIDIFACLLEHKGTVVTRSKLYQSIYTWDSETLESTIDVHISHLRRKLNIGFKIHKEYIKTVNCQGYILD